MLLRMNIVCAMRLNGSLSLLVKCKHKVGQWPVEQGSSSEHRMWVNSLERQLFFLWRECGLNKTAFSSEPSAPKPVAGCFVCCWWRVKNSCMLYDLDWPFTTTPNTESELLLNLYSCPLFFSVSSLITLLKNPAWTSMNSMLGQAG